MEWIVTECMVAAGCQLEVSAALIGEDVLLCLGRGATASGVCGADGTEGVSVRGWFGECDFFGFEFSGA